MRIGTVLKQAGLWRKVTQDANEEPLQTMDHQQILQVLRKEDQGEINWMQQKLS